jgi:glycosyltransferase involved in cell wall biosynthesis
MNKKNQKIKVLVVATSLREIGGQSIQAQNLIDAFADDDQIELTLLPNNPKTVFEKIKYLRTIFKSLKFWLLLLKNIPRFDIVQVFSSGSTGYIIATLPPLLFAKIFRKKVILNYHSGELENHIKKWKRTALPSMRKFDEIVVPSQFLVDIFAKYGLSATAIFNFVDTEKFKFRERKPLRPVFLSNRNFEAHYNVSDCLRAFQLIQQKHTEAELWVAGNGTQEKALKKLAADLNLKNVRFTGSVPPEQMPQIYDKTDIYLNSSIVDNMPVSFIEAFSAGTPVVSYKTGGIPYLIKNGQTGLLVEQNDFENLARQACFLLENQEVAQKIITNARAEVLKYSREKVRRSWKKFFKAAGKTPPK